MKKFYFSPFTKYRIFILLVVLLSFAAQLNAQRATVAIPVGIGSPCGVTGSLKDSVKYFNYNSGTKTLTTKSICQPILAAPGFSDNLATITFNPFDGYLYFTQIKLVGGIYNSYTYRWLPTSCPNPGPLPVYKTFINQFVAGVEFDPATGLGYQINFVDSTGIPSVSPDATNNVGQYTSGAVVNGTPAISYYDVTNGDLKYVRATDASGTVWGTPATVSSAGNVGQYTSLAIVNGNPAIAYYDVTNGDLKYVRAADASGTVWGVPVTVEATNIVGQFASLTVVNGNPAISYYDVTNTDLRYVRASDANGTAWGLPVAFSSIANVGQYTSMAIVNGNPAISYYDVTNGDLAYIRAADVNGTAWGIAVAAEATASNVGQYTSLSVINGNPAISYYNATAADLKYVRAADVNGATWGAATSVVTGGNVGQYTSMITVNGNPAISYYDASAQFLKYVRATNATGTAWGTPVSAEPTTNVGQYTSLMIVNGKPAVSYYDVSNGDLKYVRSNDVNGAMWYSNSGIYKMELQQVDFTSGVLGSSKPINFGGKYIYKQNGDVVMTPGGQMLAAFDNKYFTVNWKDYITATPLVATFIDTLKLGANNNLIGLAYSDGKLVGSVKNNSSACSSIYQEIDILTGAPSNVTYNAGPLANIFVSADMTDITSGIGAAKKLTSAVENPVGSKTYDLVYQVVIKNFGGTPVTSVQAYDTLSKINGGANVLSASVSVISIPSGFTVNTSYDGKTAGNFNLLTPGGTLSDIPGQNTITLQINCKIAGIQPGIVYNNYAVANGVGLFGDALRDSSTNGSNPDLNSNDRPDDPGESQATPFLVSVVPQTPPCTVLTNVLYTQTFGMGTGLNGTIPTPVLASGVTVPLGFTNYSYGSIQPVNTDSFAITKNANNANTSQFISLTDHTGDLNGQMLVVNADAANLALYSGGFNYNLCPSQQYSLSFYAAFLGNPAYKTVCDAFGGFRYPKLKIRIKDGVSGLIITEVSTSDITNTAWQQYGVKFVSSGSYSSIVFEIINDAPGGCGNDIALDDIQFGSCDPIPVVNIATGSAGCLGNSTSFTGTLNDPGALPGSKDYQWQIATAAAGPYTDIAGATSGTYTIASLTAGDVGKYYRVIIAATGNINIASCRYISPGIILNSKTSSMAATGTTKDKTNTCPGIAVTLGLTGGSLGTNASWQWYRGSCGIIAVGTGSSIIVAPLVTTTYFVRAEGDCNTTACQMVTVFISCDIDKDKDGIPDYVESNMPLALQDANGNGIINALDPTYPGFIDTNNDTVNDNFQADGDSDADGIPNYLDTTFPGRVDTNGDNVDDRFDNDKDGVINMLDLDSDNDGIPDVAEAYGVDANGDGKIDNYTDTDGDGLSQNVDANNSGVAASGLGLGFQDLDGDGVPNYLDLDSDNDGIPDLVEAGGTDANNNGMVDGYTDVDEDGFSDNLDGDVGNDGVAENLTNALLRTGLDISPVNGRADSYPYKNMDNDGRANPYDCDSDGDGIADVRESGLPYTSSTGFVNGPIGTNGWSTAVSSLPALNLRNTDGRAKADYLDIDADDDGIPDNIEGMATNSYLLPLNLDSDNDGLDNAYDATLGFGGNGIDVVDTDGDTMPDYRDLDSDADGISDIVEGNDFNGNGVFDDNVTLTLLDSDGDGLDDRFDALNSLTNIKGTSAKMGNSGAVTGDVSPGGLTPVQKTNPAATDRDWRSSGTVLPVKLLALTGNVQKNETYLTWKVIAAEQTDRFEIERSVNNSPYIFIANIKTDMPLNELQNFNYADNIRTVFGDNISYRIKVVSKLNHTMYSNTYLVHPAIATRTITISPNPAIEYVNINVFANQSDVLEMRLADNTGKVVLTQKQAVAKGNNIVKLARLNYYPEGVYSIQMIINGNLVTEKLVLVKNR